MRAYRETGAGCQAGDGAVYPVQGVPWRQAKAEAGQRRIRAAMVAVLPPFDAVADVCDGNVQVLVCHAKYFHLTLLRRQKEHRMPPVHREISRFAGTLPVQIEKAGSGPAYILLHGGAGPARVAAMIEPLATGARVIAPTLLWVQGTVRAEWFALVSDLSLMMLALIDKRDLCVGIVIGKSLGGWIAAETALRGAKAVKGAVLINAAGLAPEPGQSPITNPLSVPPQDRAQLAFHDPARFALPQTPEVIAALQASQPARLAYAGEPFRHDVHLRPRLAAMKAPGSGDPGHQRQNCAPRLSPQLCRCHCDGKVLGDRGRRTFPANRTARRGAVRDLALRRHRPLERVR